jgi:hypothetical protein
MGSAGKWVLGLLLLVVGAVFVARAVSSGPESDATVKNSLQADPASVAKENAAAEAAKQKKIASTTAGDVACKKACIEVNEVANDSVTTAKLAPGSVTLSKLAFEVPNLNELENEINARKAAEASARVAASDLSAATAKNDAAITAAAANGLTVEATLRSAADQDLATKTAAADADLLSRLNTEITNRGTADDVLLSKLNTEISDRSAALSGLRAELLNPNQVAAPIVQINNNEIVANAVTTDKIAPDTILANDLATGSVTTDEILNDTVAAIDLADGAVVGRAAGETLTNVKERTLRGERTDNVGSATSAGDLAVGTLTGERTPVAAAATGNLALGTVTGESDNDITRVNPIGNLGLRTVGRNNLVNDAIDNTKIENNAVTSSKILDGEVKTSDINDGDVVNSKLRTVDASGLNGAVSTNKIDDGAVTFAKLGTLVQGRITALETGLAAELVARANADSALQAALNTEISDRTTADSALQSALNAETASRAAADTALAGRIDELGTVAPSATVVNGAKEPNTADAKVDWSRLKNVPNDFADNKDDDGSGKVNALINDLKGTGSGAGTAPTTGNNLVSWNNLGQVPGDFVDGHISASELTGTISASQLGADSVIGGLNGSVQDGSISTEDIRDGTVAAADLAGTYADTDSNPATPDVETVVGAVTSEKIADGAIQARDHGASSVTSAALAAGAVTTDKQTANATSSTVGAPGAAVVPATPTPVVVNAASATLTPKGTDGAKSHVVQITGQFQAVGTPAGTDVMTVTWQLFDGATPISPDYHDQMTSTDSTLSGSVTQLLPSATIVNGPVEGTAKTYTLKVTASSTGAAPSSITVTNAVVTIVDLGRQGP